MDRNISLYTVEKEKWSDIQAGQNLKFNYNLGFRIARRIFDFDFDFGENKGRTNILFYYIYMYIYTFFWGGGGQIRIFWKSGFLMPFLSNNMHKPPPYALPERRLRHDAQRSPRRSLPG